MKMKKVFLGLAAAMAAYAVSAADSLSNTWIVFSSTPTDCYADGTPVKDGEIYALVWHRTGEDGALVSEFAMTADGALVDPANHKIVDMATVAKDGCCPPHAYVIPASEIAQYADGVFGVYLLDTRMTAADGSEIVGARDEDGTLSCCNGLTMADVSVNGSGVTAVKVSKSSEPLAAADAVQTPLPADAPTPVVSIEKHADPSKMLVKADGLVPYVKYTVYNKDTAVQADSEAATLVKGVSGDRTGMTFTVDKKSTGSFFKVVPLAR